jgi:lysophospholipase L1-like esterase
LINLVASWARIDQRAARLVSLLSAALILSGCAPVNQPSDRTGLATDDRYVAMGSSYAAGPGVTVSADEPKNRCARSADNYAHQFARRFHLKLIDVSCSGATTAHLLGAWDTLPPQLDAVTEQTKLVTVTIGGNDVAYIGCLIAGSSQRLKDPSSSATSPSWACPMAAALTEQSWENLESAMRNIAAEVRRRAPKARLVFIDYPVVLPDRAVCAATPLSDAQADTARATAQRLAALTAQVAQQAGAHLLRASALSHGHDACAQDPWINGYRRQDGATFEVPYHPNLKGMTAVADELDRILSQ